MPESPFPQSLLGGSWVVISGVISRVTILITHTRGLIALLITPHEPPSGARISADAMFQTTERQAQPFEPKRSCGAPPLFLQAAKPWTPPTRHFWG